jgi:hypothetical protein
MSPVVETPREQRSIPTEEIEVTVLGDDQFCVTGRVLDVSGRGLGLSLPAFLPPGSAIKVELGETLLLGEITYCVPQNDTFRAGVQVKHRLPGLARIHRLNRLPQTEASTGADQLPTASMPTPP